MPSYSYRAMSDSGRTVSGVLTAENYQVALRMLEEQALFPVKVSEGTKQFGSSFGLHRGWAYKVLAEHRREALGL